MRSHIPPLPQSHAFIVRIWWEAGLTRSDGRPLWRGRVQHAASGQSLVFQSLDDLMRFIEDHSGHLEDEKTLPHKE